MILQTTNIAGAYGKTVHTFVQIGGVVYCHSDNGRECAVFHSKRVSKGFEVDFVEVEDYSIRTKVEDVVDC